jgi:hypothetical protein
MAAADATASPRNGRPRRFPTTRGLRGHPPTRSFHRQVIGGRKRLDAALNRHRDRLSAER